MKLFAFGDSWTEGIGGNVAEEFKIENQEERTKFRNLTSWPKYLGDLLNVDFTNCGMGAASNKVIFESVVSSVRSSEISDGDLAIVMWSSTLRDNVNFFPGETWHFWSEKYKNKKHIFKTLFNKDITNFKYRKFEKEYKEYFIQNLYTPAYYDISNQNYIIFLQKMFEKMGIRYVFCDAFDPMISKNVLKELDKTHLIDKEKYWGFQEKTFADFLAEKDDRKLWEDFEKLNENKLGKHPSRYGYKLIAEELYRWINSKGILSYEIKTERDLL